MPTLMSMGTEVMLPPLELRPYGLFTQVVPEISLVVDDTDRTIFGAKWMGRDALAIALDHPVCDDDEDTTVNVVELTEQYTIGFSQHGRMRCSTIRIDAAELNRWNADDAELSRSAALVRAITTQVDAEMLNFVDDATALAGSDNLVEAVGLVEGALAERILNARGYIFIAPGLLPYAMSADVVRVSGSTLLSPGGHRVISDAGHHNGLEGTVVGTGALGYSMGSVNVLTGELGNFDIDGNDLEAVWIRYGAVVFNPLHTVKTAVTLA